MRVRPPKSGRGCEACAAFAQRLVEWPARTMFRFLFRFIGLWLLAGAFVALVIDGTRSITAGRLVVMPVAEAWLALHPTSLEWLRTTAERDVAPWLWNFAMAYVLYAPLWAALAVLGVLLILIGRQRARPIGYSSRD
jgi:hypothetical protein